MTFKPTLVPDGSTALDVLAEQLREDVIYTNQGREQWIEGMLRQAQHLREARDRFGGDDTAFGAWLAREKIEIGRDDRAALVVMGAEPELMRATLIKQTKAIHAQAIWRANKDTFRKIRKVQPQPYRRRRRQARIPDVMREDNDDKGHAAALLVRDQGKTLQQAAKEVGLKSVQPVKLAIAVLDALREHGITPSEPSKELEPPDQPPQALPQPQPYKRLSDKGLTPEQVDPDFKGTSLEFRTKYGHVNLYTKDQIDQTKRQEALMAWLGTMTELDRGARAMTAALALVDETTVREWMGKSGKTEKLRAWCNSVLLAATAIRKFCD